MGANLHYFVSDIHLGLKVPEERLIEERFTLFLKSLPKNTASLYLLGDIFDFWYEYKYVVPKGYVRVFGALAELSDRGVNIFFAKGNHDLWTFGYLEKEVGLKILREPEIIEINGVRFCVAHGDEFGGKRSHMLMKGMFKSRFLQKLLSMIHPRWTLAFAFWWSRRNRVGKGEKLNFKGEGELLYKYASDFEKRERVDHFIFGHLHTPGNCTTPLGAGFYILGEWVDGCEYLVFDAERRSLAWGTGQNME